MIVNEAPALAMFDTAIGSCGIAWTAHGICSVQLPETDTAATRDRLQQRHPGGALAAPPAAVQDVVARIVALLDGAPVDLSGTALDLRKLPAFDRRVYELALAIPPGETLEYGEIARRLGEPGAAQAVGRALSRNPCPIVVPCHRVLAAGGRAGGFTAAGGVGLKLKLLAIESRHRPFELS